jgi:hypothetical protein
VGESGWENWLVGWRGGWLGGGQVAIDPFQNLLAPTLFDCFREKTRSISNARAPSAGATAELWKGSIRVGDGRTFVVRWHERRRQK